MRKVETVYVPVQKMCEVKYYIHCYPVSPDPHFAPDKDYILSRNGEPVYFETKKEAKEEVKKHKYEFVTMKICKKIAPIDEETINTE